MLPLNTHNWRVPLPALGALGEKAIMLYHYSYHLSSNGLHKPVTSEIKTFACTWVELVGWKRTRRGKWLRKQSQKQASRIRLFGFPFNFAISSSQPLVPHQRKKVSTSKVNLFNIFTYPPADRTTIAHVIIYSFAKHRSKGHKLLEKNIHLRLCAFI